MTTPERDPALSRRLKLVGLLLLATALLAVAGCGDDNDTPAVCGSLETLRSDVEGLREIDVESGEGASDEIEESLQSIRTDVDDVKADAEAEFSEPIANLERSLEALSEDVRAVQAAGDITEESAQALRESVAAVSASWEALKTSAPDCDL